GKIPSFKIAEPEHSLAFLDINPISKGHTLVIPKHILIYNTYHEYHAVLLHVLPDLYLADILPLSKKIAGALEVKDFNIVQNIGKLAFQHVPQSTSTSTSSPSEALILKIDENWPHCPSHRRSLRRIYWRMFRGI
ncbi:hypothetical protein SISSUDRAFT_1082648, partial [Sistotremastrum suecicum HHB10207 ss-3]